MSETPSAPPKAMVYQRRCSGKWWWELFVEGNVTHGPYTDPLDAVKDCQAALDQQSAGGTG